MTVRVPPPGPIAFAVVGLALILLVGVGSVALAAGNNDGLIAGALAIAGVVAVAGALLVQEVARRPVRRLSREVRALTAGQRRGPIMPARDEDLADIAGAVNDLAASLRSQLETARTERGRLEQTLAAAADVVVAVDGTGAVVYANEAASSVLREDASAALGRPLLAVLRDHEIHALVSRALGSEAEISSAVIRQEERHYQATARPLTGGGLWEAVLVMHDVTAANDAEQTRREFVANVSHELRTPLATIAAAAETLELGLGEEDSHRFHTMIHQETDKMAQLVEEMLDLARLESGLAQPQRALVDVCVVARDALDRIRPQSQRAGLEVSLRAPESVTVEADADLMQRALGNLLQNAVKFTPAPGRVTLEVRAEAAEGEEPGAVWLLVQDTGIGLSEEDQGRVFQRFYRADWARRRGEGTGLGLALVRHIAESHGGTVRVESRLGAGSTFGFSLPGGRVVDSAG